jgi:hypothetical protein
MERSGSSVESIEVDPKAVANRFDPKPALIFKNGDLVAAVGIVEIEMQLLSA